MCCPAPNQHKSQRVPSKYLHSEAVVCFPAVGVQEGEVSYRSSEKKGTVKSDGDLILSSHAPFATGRSVRGFS